jgi:hypothetical protein
MTRGTFSLSTIAIKVSLKPSPRAVSKRQELRKVSSLLSFLRTKKKRKKKKKKDARLARGFFSPTHHH